MIEEYKEKWASFDPSASSFINSNDLEPFLRLLGYPLGLSEDVRSEEANKMMNSLQLTFYNNSNFHFMNILGALCKRKESVHDDF